MGKVLSIEACRPFLRFVFMGYREEGGPFGFTTQWSMVLFSAAFPEQCQYSHKIILGSRMLSQGITCAV